ncbi:hypothetical protein ACCD10_27885 [Pseudomonas sp. Pseusp122]
MSKSYTTSIDQLMRFQAI